jgi:cholesterol oxidase
LKHLSKPLDELKADYDVVVIGSGYGGGVSAARLSALGKRVAVIERGKEFLPGDYPDSFDAMRREFQVSGAKLKLGSRASLFDLRLGRDMHVLVGCGLGGGSLINAGVALRPDARVFANTAWPEEISSDGLLQEGFERATHMLRPTPYGGAAELVKYRALEEASKPFDVEPRPTPTTIAFDAGANAAGVAQDACTLCGDCLSGCNVGAKTTVAATYLSLAAANGTEIFTQGSARYVTRQDGRWSVAVCETPETGARTEVSERTVIADVVILAAGTLGSTEILMRSREHGLALSKRLGDRFSSNGDIIAFGYGAKGRVNAIGVGHPPKAETDPIGPCVAGQLDFRDGDELNNSLVMQEGTVPSGLASLLPALLLPGGKILDAAKSLLSSVYKGPLASLHAFFLAGHDSSNGRLELENDAMVVDWPEITNQPVYRRADEILAEALGARGGSHLQNPFESRITGKKPVTAHPLGGCAMGQDADQGVVNHKGQVFDATSDGDGSAVHDGLYVCDGAAIPRSLGANPLLTISSLAERAMILLARDRGWASDDGAPRAREKRKAEATL